MEKTNVMRLLEQKKLQYMPHQYDPATLDGISVAQQIGKDTERVFKTLVTVSNPGAYFVFTIPVDKSLDLKKAAKAVSAKSITMIKQKELLPLTGYIHGGCSPVGMKKLFPTVIHESAQNFETIILSAGKVGYQVELNPTKLAELVGAGFGDLVEAEGEAR